MESVTRWLELWREGDDAAMERVTALIYRDLRRLAAYHLKAESDAADLQATALVHEVYLRMSSLRSIHWEGRAHFISVVTKMMRQILVDHARARRAAKRSAPEASDVPLIQEHHQLDTLAVDEALERMNRTYPRCAQVVELRFFGDLDFGEIAGVMDISLATVERDWRFARAYLRKAMQG
ncbi:MAG TPA: ECF-type sigma factor [Acidobacteriaceae bacterium]|jgi:RNA polymerase sigma factor (TIGR02999 family)